MKKLIVLTLCFLFLFSTVIYGQPVDSKYKQMANELGKMLQVPKEFSIVRIEERTEEAYKEEIHIRWDNPKNDDEWVAAHVTKEGRLLWYDKNIKKSSKNTVTSYDDKVGLDKAKDFIKKTLPEYEEQLRLSESTPYEGYDAAHYIFQYYYNNVPVLGCTVNVGVKVENEEIYHMSIDKLLYEEGYSTQDEILSQEEAKNVFLNNIPVELIYRIDYSHKTTESKEGLFLPVYQMNNPYEKCIEASTGKIIVPYSNYERYTENAISPAEGFLDQDYHDINYQNKLNENQIKQLIGSGTILNKEECIKSAEQYFPKLKGIIIDEARVYPSSKSYIWSINYTKKKEVLDNELFEDDGIASGFLSCDAKTGEVFNYYLYDHNVSGFYGGDEEMRVFAEEAKKDVRNFLEEISSEEFAQCKDYSLDAEERYFYFIRMANGALVKGNCFKIEYDAKKKEIMSYEKQWYPYDFPSIEGAITPEAIVNKIPLKLYYIPIAKGEKVLGYAYDETEAYFDAFTGEKIE